MLAAGKPKYVRDLTFISVSFLMNDENKSWADIIKER